MIKDFNKKSDKDKIAFLMSQFEHMRTSRSYYENIWNDVDRLVLGVDFSYDSKPLEKKRFIDVYDGSIMKGVRTAASAYAGLIWKKFGNSIKVRPDEIEETQEVKTWFDKVNRDFAAELDDASKNFDGVLGRCITDGILKSTMAPGVHLDENGEIDATIGNGNDALFLAEVVGEEGFVYGFDVQQIAIYNSKKRLESNGIHNFELILDGHENMDTYINEEISGIMFNLGYLPKADHSITTLYKNSSSAIKKGINVLKKKGIMTIAIYWGHEEGRVEKEGLLNDLQSFNQKHVDVIKMDFINQLNQPPILIVIEKKIDGKIFDI